MLHYSPAPETALLTLGGYTSYLPGAWNRYLRDTIRRVHPWYYLRHLISSKNNRAWETNDCVFSALREYLFNQFGLLLPSQTLFAVYNERGEGISPQRMIEAISSILEPVGMEIDSVIVCNPVLRDALDCPDKIIADDKFGEYHGQAGLCMIHIGNKNSHAFYWKKMDAGKFNSEQFRLAITVRWIDGRQADLSKWDSLQAYGTILNEYASGLTAGQDLSRLALEIAKLARVGQNESFEDCPEERENFLRDLRKKLAAVREKVQANRQIEHVQLAGQMIERIFPEPINN